MQDFYAYFYNNIEEKRKEKYIFTCIQVDRKSKKNIYRNGIMCVCAFAHAT